MLVSLGNTKRLQRFLQCATAVKQVCFASFGSEVCHFLLMVVKTSSHTDYRIKGEIAL